MPPPSPRRLNVTAVQFLGHCCKGRQARPSDDQFMPVLMAGAKLFDVM
jgi:hypothetical protein